MIKKVPFDIYLPATKFDKQGYPLDAEFVQTIMIDVHDNGQDLFLTPEAHTEIDSYRIAALYKRGKKQDLDNIRNLIQYREKEYERLNTDLRKRKSSPLQKGWEKIRSLQRSLCARWIA